MHCSIPIQPSLRGTRINSLIISLKHLEHELRKERVGVCHGFDVRVRDRVVCRVVGSQFIEPGFSGIWFEGDERALIALKGEEGFLSLSNAGAEGALH